MSFRKVQTGATHLIFQQVVHTSPHFQFFKSQINTRRVVSVLFDMEEHFLREIKNKKLEYSAVDFN